MISDKLTEISKKIASGQFNSRQLTLINGVLEQMGREAFIAEKENAPWTKKAEGFVEVLELISDTNFQKQTLSL